MHTDSSQNAAGERVSLELKRVESIQVEADQRQFHDRRAPFGGIARDKRRHIYPPIGQRLFYESLLRGEVLN